MNYAREKHYTLPRLVLTNRWWAEEAEPTPQLSIEEQRATIEAWQRLLHRSVQRSGELTDKEHADFDS